LPILARLEAVKGREGNPVGVPPGKEKGGGGADGARTKGKKRQITSCSQSLGGERGGKEQPPESVQGHAQRQLILTISSKKKRGEGEKRLVTGGREVPTKRRGESLTDEKGKPPEVNGAGGPVYCRGRRSKPTSLTGEERRGKSSTTGRSRPFSHQEDRRLDACRGGGEREGTYVFRKRGEL